VNSHVEASAKLIPVIRETLTATARLWS